MAAHKLLTSSNAGELSPLLDARVDIEKYHSGCQQLENFLILPYGGVLRRAGTEWLGTPKFADRMARLVSFNFSTTTNFQIEFGHQYCRFWSNGFQVIKATAPAWVTATPYVAGVSYVTVSAIIYYCVVSHTSGATFATDLTNGNWVAQSIVEVITPYQEAQLRELQFCQINDLLYIVHPEHYVAKLTRVADENWTWGRLSWVFPPALDENITETTITPSATTGNITLTASTAIFESSHVGGWWLIGHARTTAGASNAASAEVVMAAVNATSTMVRVIGPWEMTTFGSWAGELRIERRPFGGTIWEILRTYRNNTVGERNVSTTGNEEKLMEMRLNWFTLSVAGTNPLARLSVGEARYFGAVEITGLTSATVVSATVRLELNEATATKLWAEAAFSSRQGFPRAIALHDGRLMLAATKLKPLKLYGSVIDDFENFRTGSREDQAIAFTIAANESNPINWMVNQQGKLLLGTAGEEWSMAAQDDAAALSATNVRAIRQSSYGSAFIQAKLINEVIMFVQRQGKKLRELTFAFEKDGWVAPDLCILANHISDAGFRELAFQQQPDAVLWAITAGGALVGMTYERDQNVVGWHRHTTEGVFETVSAIYGGSGPDEVWFIVKRTINGVVVRYIERMKPDHREAWDQEDKASWWYLDAAKKGVFAVDTSVIAGLSHLEGKAVYALVDGATQGPFTVSGGQITLQHAGKNILVGLKFTSVMKPMKLDIPLPDGTSSDRKGKIHKVAIRVHKSVGMQLSNDDITWQDIYFREQGNPMDASPPVFTGTKKVPTGAPYRDQCEIAIRQDKPMPLCILSIAPALDFHGD